MSAKKNSQETEQKKNLKMEAIEKSDFLNNIFMTLFPF